MFTTAADFHERLKVHLDFSLLILLKLFKQADVYFDMLFD